MIFKCCCILATTASDLQGSNPDLTDREEGADVPDIPGRWLRA